MSARSLLYRAARFLGDVQAASKGPTALAKRIARKAAYRQTNKGLAGLLRKAKL